MALRGAALPWRIWARRIREVQTHSPVVCRWLLALLQVLIKPGDVIEVREKSRQIARINEALDGVMRRGVPSWVELERDAFKGTVKTLPVRAEMTTPAFQEQLIVELYSK